ncbi:MAG: hypothetical protein EXR29_09950 [Betaproteobacteria bacterium]|nr:hypothetical protein [Betaproteobacteria bacterium]
MRAPLLAAASAAILLSMLPALPARAALGDEIQVYTDEINKPGEFGLELHVNTTPRGRNTPDYPGEVTPAHGIRFTPEFSWGLTRTLEAGVYLPYVRDAQGTTHFSGPKLRLKWLPLQAGEDGTGWFGGLNAEYAWIAPELERSTQALELRPIIGYRSAQWLFAANPILGWAMTGPDRNRKPDFSPAFKIARTLAPGLALGAEYYTELGRVGNFLAHGAQSHTLYLALDYDRKPWAFNVGIGRGLTIATDRWTVKAIFDIPFD